MPLGFERVNERTQRPNALINFIKPLPGPTSSTAEDILNRVAAICYPFMKKHMILVQALEEFPSNNEFVGRNFNAGEVIQLVLRNRRGQWLPERWVMMVMVHELAHCKQMNHSKAFWKVRDTYAADLRDLWSKGYTGEGLWGRGRALDSGLIHAGSVATGDIPEHLCGGTYSRKRKRRRGGKGAQELSYAEKKQRRILKKFGAGGQALGADDDTKVKLEGGVAKKGKPRVAGSARGRELRAAAALARFQPVVKKEDSTVKEEQASESETEDEYEDAGAEDAAIDVDGKKMLDDQGRVLVKICEDGDDRDENARREMNEFRDLEQPCSAPNTVESPVDRGKTAATSSQPRQRSSSIAQPKRTSALASVIHLDELYKQRPTSEVSQTPEVEKGLCDSGIACSVCSLLNQPGSITCEACSNVLKPKLMPNSWKCRNTTCQDSLYVNSGDAGICGLCGKYRHPAV